MTEVKRSWCTGIEIKVGGGGVNSIMAYSTWRSATYNGNVVVWVVFISWEAIFEWIAVMIWNYRCLKLWKCAMTKLVVHIVVWGRVGHLRTWSFHILCQVWVVRDVLFVLEQCYIRSSAHITVLFDDSRIQTVKKFMTGNPKNIAKLYAWIMMYDIHHVNLTVYCVAKQVQGDRRGSGCGPLRSRCSPFT